MHIAIPTTLINTAEREKLFHNQRLSPPTYPRFPPDLYSAVGGCTASRSAPRQVASLPDRRYASPIPPLALSGMSLPTPSRVGVRVTARKIRADQTTQRPVHLESLETEAVPQL